MPLGVLAFWLGMSFAAVRFPAEYDWRYMTISMLLYPERNPLGHWWASGGLALCGLCGFIWACAQLQSGVRTGILAAGYFCMVCSSLLPERLIAIPHGHEILAIAAFVCICIGLVRTVLAVTARGQPPTRSRVLVVLAIPLAPMLAAAATQLYLDVLRPDLPWVGLLWRELGVPLGLSFALWEWATCIALSLYMAALAFVSPLAAR
jgi:hypothetical protein